MASQLIKNILKEHSNENGLPVFDVKQWADFKQNFSVSDGKHAFAEYIVENNIPFPLQYITKQEVISKFNKLQNTEIVKLLTTPETTPTDKFNDYEYSIQKYCKDIIELGHYYNNISNYFHQTNDITVKIQSGEIENQSNPPEDWIIHLVNTGMNTQTGGRIRRAMKFAYNKSVFATHGDGLADINLSQRPC